MSDCISRRLVLDELNKMMGRYLTEDFVEVLVDLSINVEAIPSVTPTQNCVENALGALDCISRQAVNEITNDIRDCISVEGYCAILERLKKLPSVNPQEPKTGHWINYIDKSGCMNFQGMCDKCGFIHTFIDCHTSQYNFCPNCGCHMVKTQEGEDKG